MAGTPPRRYDFIRYNRYGALRPGAALWTALLFQCRHVIGIVLLMAAGGRGTAPGTIDLSDFGHLINPLFLIADIPALALLLAAAARLPEAGPLPRLAWRHGRLLLLGSVALYLALFLHHLPARPAAMPLADWLGLGGTGAVAGFALASAYLRDLFADFPSPPQDPAKPA